MQSLPASPRSSTAVLGGMMVTTIGTFIMVLCQIEGQAQLTGLLIFAAFLVYGNRIMRRHSGDTRASECIATTNYIMVAVSYALHGEPGHLLQLTSWCWLFAAGLCLRWALRKHR